MSKKKDAIWALVFELATKVNAELEKGNIVIWDNAVLEVPFLIDAEKQKFQYVTDGGRCIVNIHNGADEAWGTFETQKSVREFFSREIRVLQPIKWM
jgi:hypothetical protein